MESLRQRHAMRYRERNIRCKLYPLSSILVLSGTHPVIQQMSSTTTEILITIRFASIPQNIHMDMIYTPPSPSPSKLYIYHFRLRLRRYIMSYSPPGTSRGQILWHNYFHCQSVAIFLRNYVCFFIFFFLSLFTSSIKDLSKLTTGSPATAISNNIGFQLQASGLYSSWLKPGPIRFLKLIQYIFNRSNFMWNFKLVLFRWPLHPLTDWKSSQLWYEISREHDACSYDISPRTWNYDEINLTRHE